LALVDEAIIDVLQGRLGVARGALVLVEAERLIGCDAQNPACLGLGLGVCSPAKGENRRRQGQAQRAQNSPSHAQLPQMTGQNRMAHWVAVTLFPLSSFGSLPARQKFQSDQ